MPYYGSSAFGCGCCCSGWLCGSQCAQYSLKELIAVVMLSECCLVKSCCSFILSVTVHLLFLNQMSWSNWQRVFGFAASKCRASGLPQQKSFFSSSQSKQLNSLSSSNIQYQYLIVDPLALEQFYNTMFGANCRDAEQAVRAVLATVMDRTQQQIRLGQFVVRNQPVFVLEKQREVIESNFKHIIGSPLHSLNHNEQEPVHIAEDNFMNAGVEETNPVTTKAPPKLSAKTITDNGLRRSKREEIALKDVKIKQNDQLLSQCQALFKEAVHKDSQSDILRLQKEESQRIAKLNLPKIRPKLQCKLGANEKIVFDYEGCFTKRKESPAKDFNKIIVEATAPKDLSQSQQIGTQQRSGRKQVPVLAGRLSPKSQMSKLKTSQQQQNRQIFLMGNKKEDIINSLKITSPGIKMIFDGNVVNSQYVPQSKHQRQRGQKIQKGKTVGVYKQIESVSDRFKTEGILETQIILPSAKRKDTSRKTRTGTETTDYQPSILGRISVQNQFLHKMVVNQEDLDNRYIKIPSKQGLQRRIKTNIESSSVRRDEDVQKLRIRQRLTSLTKEGDRLPMIINNYKRAEGQIYKEFRLKFMERY